LCHQLLQITDMKKIIIAMAALAMAIGANAQQALFGGPSVESPVINEDGTVTFRFQAPKAIKVEVTGEFLPPQKN
jgi:enterochelin esterase family protein